MFFLILFGVVWSGGLRKWSAKVLILVPREALISCPAPRSQSRAGPVAAHREYDAQHQRRSLCTSWRWAAGRAVLRCVLDVRPSSATSIRLGESLACLLPLALLRPHTRAPLATPLPQLVRCGATHRAMDGQGVLSRTGQQLERPLEGPRQEVEPQVLS